MKPSELQTQPPPSDGASPPDQNVSSVAPGGSAARRLRPRWRRIILFLVVAVLALPILASCFSASAPPASAERTEHPGPRRNRRPPPGMDAIRIAPEATEPLIESTGPARSDEATTYELDAEQAAAVLAALRERGLTIDAAAPREQDRDAPPPPRADQPDLHPGRTRVVSVAAQDTTILRLAVATREAPLKTLVTFADEREIALTLSESPSQYLDYVVDANTLHLSLRSARATADILVKGASGVSYRLLLGAGTADDYDGSVTISLRTDVRRGPHAPSQVEELSMAMYQLANPVGVVVYDGGDDLAYDVDGLQIQIRYVYESPLYTGYVCRMTNRRKGPWLVEKERFAGDGLILVGAEATTIEAGASTTLYLTYLRDDSDE